jgi:5-methylcytosine-specific restriction protein A
MEKGQARYLGCFACNSWEPRIAPDKRGQSRRAIVFHLVPVGERLPSEAEDLIEVAVAEGSLEEMRRRALASGSEATQANTREAKLRYYERNATVRAYVLRRANGTCEACQRPAPFRRSDGTPYLEPHHTRKLSDSGPDHPRWIGGICPNCHRQIHYGSDGQDVNRRLQDSLGALEERMSR